MGYFWSIVTAVTTIIGNVTAKLWADSHKTQFFIITLVFYVMASVAFPLALRHGRLTVLNAFTTVIIFALTSLAGLWYFKEKLQPYQLIGLAFAFAAIILLSIEKVPIKP